MTMTEPRGPRYKGLPIWRDANRFLLEIEPALRDFPRYQCASLPFWDKCTLGSELRGQAMSIYQQVARAAQCKDAAERARLLEHLVWQVEDTKMSLQWPRHWTYSNHLSSFQFLLKRAFNTLNPDLYRRHS